MNIFSLKCIGHGSGTVCVWYVFLWFLNSQVHPSIQPPISHVPRLHGRQFKFPAFQAGPRVCLGRNMAMLEAKMCISVLLKHFDFAFADGFKMVYKSRCECVGGRATSSAVFACPCARKLLLFGGPPF